jgi:hypothetical protein
MPAPARSPTPADAMRTVGNVGWTESILARDRRDFQHLPRGTLRLQNKRGATRSPLVGSHGPGAKNNEGRVGRFVFDSQKYHEHKSFAHGVHAASENFQDS